MESTPKSAAAGGVTPTVAWSRQQPFVAELIGHERLTQPGSLKDTRHFVLSLAGSGLT